MNTKTCNACGLNLPLESYNKCKTNKDGHENKCKKCRQEARKRHSKNCDACGNIFKTSSLKTKYCSSDCAGSVRKSRVKVNCSYCNREKEVVHSLAKRLEKFYCDNKCRAEHLKFIMSGDRNPNYSKVKIGCSGCGKEIEVQPYRLEKHKHQFCSQGCYRENIGKFYTGANNSNYKEPSTIYCDGCGTSFTRKDGDVNKNGKNYCSHSCYIANDLQQKERAEIVVGCAECGVEVKRYRRLVEKRTNIFCCTKCKAAFYARIFKGANHPNWNPYKTLEERIRERNYEEYKQWRIAVFERDKFTCQKCADDTGGNLVAHHIFNYAEHAELRTDVNNGAALCQTCHKHFHAHYGYTKNDDRQFIQFLKGA